ncbi:hypothetical protein VTJ04DRAFT_6255 [Mycothermus thermophilus]|uniref:uncharacterized protein n=1 Tax=Humicola insolens TaxID=85995 RepID=UPI0037430CC7
MAPALALRRAISRSTGFQSPKRPPSICLVCSWTGRHHQRRLQSSSSNPRKDLHRALSDLQTHAPNYANLPRLQLALRNLSEPAGHESIRVAVLNLPPPNTSSSSTKTETTTTTTAQRLLRLTLADPLRSPAADWEYTLESHPLHDRPLIVRVDGGNEQTSQQQQEWPGIDIVLESQHQQSQTHAIPEVRANAPLLRDAGLEVLLADGGFLATAAVEKGRQAVEDAVLTPTVAVAATTAGHVAPVEAPVHVALVVGEGVDGAGRVFAALPGGEEGKQEVVKGVVNFSSKIGAGDLEGCPFAVVNVDSAEKGLELFRENVANASKYETLWTEANIRAVSEWLRKAASPKEDGTTKPPVRRLIGSLLQQTRAKLEEETKREESVERPKTTTTVQQSEAAAVQLFEALADWAKKAHQELQEQLDLGFVTGSWSRLSWWKLFWRADDVGMAASELVAVRFLPQAEKDLIYLAGRIREAGLAEIPYTTPTLLPESSTSSPPSTKATTTTEQNPDTTTPSSSLSEDPTTPNWPQHIPFTRTYIHTKTIPALQALAQLLVAEAATLSGLSTALAALSYFSAFGGIYECGAIAALGTAVACRRMQRRWDEAREFWQEKVREEGRKAVRATEESVAEVLSVGEIVVRREEKKRWAREKAEGVERRERVKEVLERAERALGRLR